ncbi:DUF1028 domain-containing protein [Bradyrhizobium sp. LHD-71]|uniref:DUF1028 domain-containing protein n=1 Tax=Bradyrhizobium sp. LHD-71 TaxID=3072141 RepID=UPI00280E9111|nr:DUF1028 domain-containing protein [Bradyrhizobium sp. LHD-71]MDQ8729797.1 DUF1028 domain-containing protein [Bradyrhizobium sp. LHD-71]
MLGPRLGPLGEEFSTFAISARCPETGKFGVAISTRPIGVGSRCPFVRPGVGVVVTMAVTDPRLGPLGIRLLDLGFSASKTMAEIAASDPHIDYRQISVIDRDGNAVARTGGENHDWSGHFCEPGMVAMGNGLISERTASAMANTFRAMKGDDLEARLMSALEAGRDAGGQHGGQHSAALMVYRQHEYPLVDLRVDEHVEPIGELRRVFDLYRPQIEYYETRPWQPAALGVVEDWVEARACVKGGKS